MLTEHEARAQLAEADRSAGGLQMKHRADREWWRVTDPQIAAFRADPECPPDLRIECDIALREHPVLRGYISRRRARQLIAAALWALGKEYPA